MPDSSSKFSRPARRSFRGLWLAIGCLTVVTLPIVAAVGWWWWSTRSPRGQPVPDAGGASARASERELIPLDLGVADAAPLVVVVGSSGDLFPGEVELTASMPEGSVPLYAAISIDGSHWSRVPATIDGNRVTFRTRHFCAVTIIGLSQWTAIVLPIVAVTYVVVERADELPKRFHPDAPFVSLDVNPRGFQIFWSKSLPGVEKSTGFRDEKRYRAELERLAKDHGKTGGSGTSVALSMNAEIHALKRKYLMPDKVREVEDALVFAQSYLASRKIASPALSIPVYVVPTLGENAGMIHNPWAGRRYMLVGANAGSAIIWTTALHELFHHYQTGYVWLDRTSHLPFLEASALLMEREAIVPYAAAGKPFNAGEGLVLAQMLVYRNGLDGPKAWEEQYVRLHGYGLTWFLEYLRDEKYVGTTKRNDPGDFHAALLTEWGKRWTGALHTGLQWAAGNERELASGWVEFAQTKVLEGKVDNCGAQNPYGRAYKSCPFIDSPYTAHLDDYGLPASRLDLAKSPVATLDDDSIRPWSIQFYEVSAKGATKSIAVVRVPRAWLPKSGPSRGVFLRSSADEGRVVSMSDADVAAPSHPDAYAKLPVAPTSYAYVVDSGQSGSSWFSSNAPMTVYLLGPPLNVKSEVAGKVQTISWSPPAAATTAGLVHAARVYTAGSTKPERTVEISATSVELALVGSPHVVELTSAVEVGRDESGKPLYLESPRSEPVTSVADAERNADSKPPASDPVVKPTVARTGSWVYEGFSANDWKTALDAHNARTVGWKTGIEAASGRATFSCTCTGTRKDSWMRPGLSEKGTVSYSPLGAGAIKPDDEIAVPVTVTNGPRDHSNFYGIASASVRVVRYDKKGKQRGTAGSFKADDKTEVVGYYPGAGKVTQAPVTKVLRGQLPAGSFANERIAIRVQMTGSGIEVQHDYCYRWVP